MPVCWPAHVSSHLYAISCSRRYDLGEEENAAYAHRQHLPSATGYDRFTDDQRYFCLLCLMIKSVHAASFLMLLPPRQFHLRLILFRVHRIYMMRSRNFAAEHLPLAAFMMPVPPQIAISFEASTIIEKPRAHLSIPHASSRRCHTAYIKRA